MLKINRIGKNLSYLFGVPIRLRWSQIELSTYSGLGVCIGGAGGRDVIVGSPFSCICDIVCSFLLIIILAEVVFSTFFRLL